MATGEFYRGGNSLKPKRREVIFDRGSGLVLPARGVSVASSPVGLDKFGGAYRVSNVPAELHIVQIGRNPNHYEIVPVRAMTWVEYEEALDNINLVPVQSVP